MVGRLAVWQLGIVLHRVVLVRIHSGGVMYNGEQNRGSSKQAKRGVSFSPGCRRCMGEMIRVSNLDSMRDFLGGYERSVVSSYMFVFARR